MTRKKVCLIGIILTAVSLIFTLSLKVIDVDAIGPQGTSVGFSALNGAFAEIIGVRMSLYTVTDWLGVLPVLTAAVYALVGLMQWIMRKSLRKVDKSIFWLAFFYVLIIVIYVFFEKCVINYRPVLIDGYLEASFPSSHTVVSCCLMMMAKTEARILLRDGKICKVMDIIAVAVIAVIVLGRLFSGVHWLTDIIGGLLISGAALCFYTAAVWEDLQKVKDM